MKSFSQLLHDSWFEAAPATRLALLRILVGAYAFGFLMVEHDDYLEVAKTSHQLFAPVGVIFHGPIDPGLFGWLLHATLVAGLCFTLGICHRVVGPIFAGLLLWMFCYRNSWSMIYHSDNLVALHVIVLGLARSADALSLDAMFRFRGGGATAARGGLGNLISWQYGWPVKLICTVTVCAYFVTGVAKLCSELGLGWMTGQNLRAQMAVDAIRKELLGGSPNPVAYSLYGWLPLFSVLAVGTMIVEFFAPLALLHRRAGKLWALTAFGFHWGILIVMNIKFHYQLWGIMFASFFFLERTLDWPGKLLRRILGGMTVAPGTSKPATLASKPAVLQVANPANEPGAGRQPALRQTWMPARQSAPSLPATTSHATLYYDGECGLCDRFVQFVLRHDDREYFRFATLQSAAGHEHLSRLGLLGRDFKTVVLVEDGESYVRSSATLRVCRRLAGPWPLLYAFIVVPKVLRDAVYSLITRNRKRWVKPPATCAVLPPKWRQRFIS